MNSRLYSAGRTPKGKFKGSDDRATVKFTPANRNADIHMMRPLQLAACLAISALPFAAAAQQDATATPAEGSVEEGRMLAYTCMGCHGIPEYRNAYPAYRVPKIGGQSREYLTNALTEYKRGTRQHPTMEAQAGSYSDQDIADLAAFLSSLNK